jgi:hypothetical protein
MASSVVVLLGTCIAGTRAEADKPDVKDALRQVPELGTIDDPPWPDPDLLRLYGRRNLDLIRTADRVDVLDLDNNPHHWRPLAGETSRRLVGFPIVETRRAVSRKVAQALKDAVLTPRFYYIGSLGRDPDTGVGYGRAKGCVFSPGAAVRFVHGKSSVVVLLCFSCDDLAIAQRQLSNAALRRWAEDDDFIGRVDISAGADVFKQLIARAHAET